jgi:hypothetical protein
MQNLQQYYVERLESERSIIKSNSILKKFKPKSSQGFVKLCKTERYDSVTNFDKNLLESLKKHHKSIKNVNSSMKFSKISRENSIQKSDFRNLYLQRMRNLNYESLSNILMPNKNEEEISESYNQILSNKIKTVESLKNLTNSNISKLSTSSRTLNKTNTFRTLRSFSSKNNLIGLNFKQKINNSQKKSPTKIIEEIIYKKDDKEDMSPLQKLCCLKNDLIRGKNKTRDLLDGLKHQRNQNQEKLRSYITAIKIHEIRKMENLETE